MELKQIDIKELENLEKICFHFTPKTNEESIAKQGLVPANSNDLKAGFDKPKQVYFSKGQEAALSLMNRYLNLLVGQSPTSDKTPIKPGYMSEKRILDDTPLTKTEVFEYMMELFKDNIYFALDLKEGEDYNPKAINPESKRGHHVTPRNMNTYADKAIPPEKSRKISIDGKTDALSILTYMYENYIAKGNKIVNTYGNEEEQLIGEFMDYVKSNIFEENIEDVLKKVPIPDFSKEDSSEVVVLKFIEYIKDIEKTRGLTEEQTIAKYVHGCCEELMTNTLEVLRIMNKSDGIHIKINNCKMPKIENLYEGNHFVVGLMSNNEFLDGIKTPEALDALDAGIKSPEAYYDILGRHEPRWMTQYFPERFYIENEHYIHTKRQMSEYQLDDMIPRYAVLNIYKILEQEKYVPNNKASSISSFDKLLEGLDALDKDKNKDTQELQILSQIEEENKKQFSTTQIGKKTINAPILKKVEANNAEVTKISTIDKKYTSLDDN